MKHSIIKTGILMVFLLSLQGCIVVDREGHGDINRSATIGEELEDLADAYEDGLLSEREYERARRRILDR